MRDMNGRKANCWACRFFSPAGSDDPDYGQCRKLAPPPGKPDWKWAEVQVNWWCGAFVHDESLPDKLP